MLKLIFWILIFLVFYTYLGYGILLLFLNTIKKFLKRHPADEKSLFEPPEVTLLVAAWNERSIVNQKMQNTRNLTYPKDRLKIVWITDGSSDGTPEVLGNYKEVKVLHQPERQGKTAALNRALKFIDTPFVVFSDANTILRPDSIMRLMEPFSDERVGCVAGEKRITRNYADVAAGAGEGTYWRYEAWLKIQESKYSSALAAAGELYAIRTSLFKPVNPDSIIDDFIISMDIARQGYLIKYQPLAIAEETSSLNIKEELKRKVRIASGAVQTVFRYPFLLNIFRHGFLSFEFISHKFLRWMIVPLAIPLILVLNVIICLSTNFTEHLYTTVLALQSIFYIFVVIGLLLEGKPVRLQFIFLPSYLAIVNYAQYAGFIRYLRKKHNVIWEKARRV